MTRINITETDEDGARLVGWFDPAKSELFTQGEEWDGNNNVGVITRSQWIDQYLYRTRAGRWVLNTDATRYHNGADSYRYITDDEAQEWLIRSEVNDEALARYFGELPDEPPAPAKPGRPAVGDQIKIAMPADMLAAIDADATAQGVSRSEWIRRACAAAL